MKCTRMSKFYFFERTTQSVDVFPLFLSNKIQGENEFWWILLISFYKFILWIKLFDLRNSKKSEKKRVTLFVSRMAPKMLVKDNPNISHWNLENGYENGWSEHDYPLRVFNARQGAALVLCLNIFEENLEYVCKGPIQGKFFCVSWNVIANWYQLIATKKGFKIILSAPGEIIKMSRHSFRVPLLEQADISIIPKLTYTSEELRSYKPSQRQCFFNSERQLQFFKFYAQHNCEAECLSNYTKIKCGCVKFSLPSKIRVEYFRLNVDIVLVKNLKSQEIQIIYQKYSIF